MPGILDGTYVSMVVWLVLAVSLALGGMFLVRKYYSHEIMQEHHAVAGPFLSIIATLYAVVVGFIVVDAMNSFQSARLNVEREANCIHDMWHLAQGIPDPVKSDMRKLCLEYADTMVNYEWPSMAAGQFSDQGHPIFTRLWHDVVGYQPKNDADSMFLSQMVTELQAAGDARHSRLLAARSSYDPAIWIVIGAGSVIVVVFTYFFGVQNIKMQALMTALVTIVVTLNLVAIDMFGTPFSGDVRVSSRAFQQCSDYFKSELHEK
jgi:hypothetical protein